MLYQLPTEILLMIVEELPRPRDRANLSFVSKRMHQVVIPRYYNTTVVLAHEDCLYKLNVPSAKTCFMEDGSKSYFNCLWPTKALRFVAPIHSRTRRRCYTARYGKTEGFWKIFTDNGLIHRKFEEETAFGLQNLEAYLPKDSLRVFAWNLGCCPPNGLLSAAGYLPFYQRRIRVLSLVTDITCTDPTDLDGLPLMEGLRSLTWKGIGDTQHHRDILHETVVANSNHLVRLELDAPTTSLRQLIDLDQFFGLPYIHSLAVKLPHLQYLSLAHISLKSAAARRPGTFFLGKLMSLKLRSCLGADIFLERLSSSPQGLYLQSLEVVFIDDTKSAEASLERFLQSFKGLRKFYITTLRNVFIACEPIVRVLSANHGRTLERLIFDQAPSENPPLYERSPSTVPNCALRWIGPECAAFNVRDMCTSSLKQGLSQQRNASEALKLLHFRFHAFQHNPRDLNAELSNAATTPLRDLDPNNGETQATDSMSMRDLLELAEWAFGPTGLPNLTVIAYSDFTQGRRYEWSQLVLCRIPTAKSECMSVSAEPQPFQIINPAEFRSVLNRIEGAQEMLSACPTEHAQM